MGSIRPIISWDSPSSSGPWSVTAVSKGVHTDEQALISTDHAVDVLQRRGIYAFIQKGKAYVLTRNAMTEAQRQVSAISITHYVCTVGG